MKNEEFPLTGEQLLAMPLHMITEAQGEPGLRRRFDAELERFSPEDRLVLEDARDLALELHEDDERGREPYNNHILRVAIRVMAPSHYGVDDTDVIVGALLHDSVEDHAKKLARMGEDMTSENEQIKALRYLEHRFGEGPADIVAAVTNPEFDRDGDWQQEYRDHVERSLTAVPKARPVKLSDFTDNGVGVIYSLPERIPHFSQKYAPLTPTLKEIVALADTPLSEPVREHILEQLELAEKRFAPFLK